MTTVLGDALAAGPIAAAALCVKTVDVLDLCIAMAGPAGSGKSTLSESLGASLQRDGAGFEVFGEDELFRRSEFSEVAEAFRSADGPEPAAP